METRAGDPALKRSFRGHRDHITSVSYAPGLKQVASGSDDSLVSVWHFKASQRPYKFTGHKSAVLDVQYAPQGDILASCSKDCSIRLWTNNVESKSVVIKAHSASVRIADKKFVCSLSGHANWVRSGRFSPDGRLVVSGSDDKTVKLWDIQQRQPIHTFLDHTGMVSKVKFHPEGNCIASCGSDKKIKVFDIRSKRLIQHYDAHADLINCISFHPSGQFLLSASSDATLKIWDLNKGCILYTLYGHEGAANACDFSPNGETFVSGGNDAIVMVWKTGIEPDKQQQQPSIAKMTANIQQEPLNTGIEIEGIQIPQQNHEQAIPPQAYLSHQSVQNVQSTPIQYQEQNLDFSREYPQQRLYQASHVQQEFIQSIPAKATKPVIFNLQLQSNQIPEELQTTLNKMINQIDIITKTLDILDKRVATSENQITNLSNFIREYMTNRKNEEQ